MTYLILEDFGWVDQGEADGPNRLVGTLIPSFGEKFHAQH